MLKRLLGEINTKELFEHCSASQPGWHWVTSFWQNLVVGHETLSLVTWAPPGHCFSKLWTLLQYLIFSLPSPQCRASGHCCPAAAEPMTASWNLRQTFWHFFSTRTEIKALAARDPVSAGLAVTGPTLTVIMAWLCSHGSGSGSHRMKAAGELFSGNWVGWPWAPGERVVLCHESSANSLHVTPAPAH